MAGSGQALTGRTIFLDFFDKSARTFDLPKPLLILQSIN
jgi:hypothetical protein